MTKGKRPAALLTTGQAAERAGVSRQALHIWITDGLPVRARRVKLPAVKAYGRYLVDPADLAKWLEAVGRK